MPHQSVTDTQPRKHTRTVCFESLAALHRDADIKKKRPLNKDNPFCVSHEIGGLCLIVICVFSLKLQQCINASLQLNNNFGSGVCSFCLCFFLCSSVCVCVCVLA